MAGLREGGRWWVLRGGCAVSWMSAMEVHVNTVEHWDVQKDVGKRWKEVPWRSAMEVRVSTALGSGAVACVESGSTRRDTVLVGEGVVKLLGGLQWRFNPLSFTSSRGPEQSKVVVHPPLLGRWCRLPDPKGEEGKGQAYRGGESHTQPK